MEWMEGGINLWMCHIARITWLTCFYKFHIITSAAFKYIFVLAALLFARAVL